MSEPRAADFRLQESDFSKQPRRKFPTQKLFAATDSPPRVWGHGCRKTVRSRSQGRRPAKKQMRDDPEFRLKSVVVRPLGRTGQASSVARRRRSVMIVRVRLERTHSTSSKRSSARSTRFRSGDSGPNRSTCPNGPWLERFEPFPVDKSARHKLLANAVQNRRKQDGFSQVPIVNDSKARSVVPRWHLMLIARHGQALMFCDFAVHQKRSPMQEANKTTGRKPRCKPLVTQAKSKLRTNEALRMRELRGT